MKELIEIQSKLSVVKDQSKSGIQFKYRTAELILEKVKPLLKAEGMLLTLTDSVVQVGSDNYIKSTATVYKDDKSISCDGWAKEPIKLMSMSAPQITGSCSSYARKTALGGLFAIDDNKDPDSDNGSKEKRTKEDTTIKQQILNRLSTLTEREKNGYREEVKAGNWDFNQSFLDHLVSKYGVK